MALVLYFTCMMFNRLILSALGHVRSASQDLGSPQEQPDRSQVVAVGTPLPTAALPVGAHQGPVMVTLALNVIVSAFEPLLSKLAQFDTVILYLYFSLPEVRLSKKRDFFYNLWEYLSFY